MKRTNAAKPRGMPRGKSGADTGAPNRATTPVAAGGDIAPAGDNFRTFFETLDDMIFVGDPEGRILFSNRAASRKLGYTPEELRAMHLIDVHPAELKQKAAEIVGAMLRGERETCPLPLEKKSGERLLVETRVWQGKWDGEDCLFGLCKDITEAQEAQQRFELLFRNSPSLMALSTLPERKFVDVNTTFLSALGYSKDEIIGKTSAELGLFPDAASIERVAATLESDGRITNMEIQVRCADGTLLEGLFSAEVVVMKGERHLLTVMIDVSAFNLTTRLLQESEGRFRRMADSAPVLLWESGPDALCSYFSKPWLDFTGRTMEQEIGNGWTEGVHSDDLEACLRTYRLAFQAHREFKMEYRLQRADGEYRWLLDHGVPRFAPDGSFLGFIGSCLDITEFKEAKRSREELLGRLLKIAGRVPGVIYQYRLRPDGTSCFPFASDAIRDIYRVTPYEVRKDASKVFANLHPDDRDGVVESILESAKDLTPWQHGYRVKFSDGTIRSLYGDAVPQREADGSVLWHGFISDVTDRKQAEEDIRHLADRLSLATKAGGVGIWDWDVANDILVWDDNMYRLYGITRDQFAGAYVAWKAGLHPDDRERGDAEIRMALRGEKDFNTDFRVRWPDGSTHHIRAMALVQRDAAGKPLHMVGTNWDITDQERVDDSLRAAAAYARNLIEVNLDPLVTISIQGIITDVNEATITATGLQREQLVGTDFSDYFTEPDKARAGYLRAFDKGLVRDYPLTLRHSSGQTTDVLYNASVYRDPHGKVLGVFAAARDITERKRAEGIVLQNVARAEELARLKSRFVSMASHELRTPLANIMLACEILKNFWGVMPEKRTQAVLAGLVTGVASMEHTLNDLLFAGKIEEGKLPFMPAGFALPDFLAKCSEEAQQVLECPPRIDIVISGPAPNITADERLLHHVVKNLLENALKYSPEETRVEVAATASGGSLTISVRDRGIGVPEAERKYLFEAFSRASNVGDKPGSGLGLFIAQKCAQAHGGYLRYQPRPEGSVFSITIPAPAHFSPST